MVEPGHPFQGCQFLCHLDFPMGSAVVQFCPAKPIDRLGQGVALAGESGRAQWFKLADLHPGAQYLGFLLHIGL